MQYGGKIGRAFSALGLGLAGLALTFSGCAEHRLHEVRTYIDADHDGKYDHERTQTFEITAGKKERKVRLLNTRYRKIGKEEAVEIKFEK